MPIKKIEYNGREYPAIQSEGHAAQWILPFAKEYCKGIGFDVGCMKLEWRLPDSIAVDPVLNEWDAMNLPAMDYLKEVDYIFSSHCLEHLTDWVAALDYWATLIKSAGVLFLYLPNCDYQVYWQPANNRKHLHYMNPTVIKAYFDNRKDLWQNVFVAEGYDLNGSFTAIAEKI